MNMTKYKIYKDGRLSVVITSKIIKEMDPEWDGELNVGDRFYIEEKEVRVTEKTIRFDDDEIELHVENFS